jgi:hypothetical protein
MTKYLNKNNTHLNKLKKNEFVLFNLIFIFLTTLSIRQYWIVFVPEVLYLIFGIKAPKYHKYI